MKKITFLAFLLFPILLLLSQDSSVPEKTELSVTDRLASFAELYGIVRYFHPSDEASSIDWNKFAQYGADLIQNTETEPEFLQEIQGLFSLLAPSISFAGDNYQWEKNRLKPIFWKHLGLGQDSNSRTYKSVRINKDTDEKFYAVGTNVRGLDLATTRIRLTYHAKSEGLGYGYLKILGKEKEKLFFKNHQANPVANSVGENREIVSPLLNDIKGLNLGMITKRGKSIFKDIQLFYETKNGKWKKIPLPKYTDSSWYPVKKAILRKEKDSIVVDFEKEKKRVFFNYKTVGDTDISVPLIVYEEKKGRTIPLADTTALADLKSILDKYEVQHSNTSCLSNIIISWNIFRHFYPYQEEVKVDWKEILNKGIEEALNVKNREEEWLALQKFTEVFDDGHIRITPTIRYDSLIQKRMYNIPVSFKYIDDNLVVDKVKGEIDSIKAGDIVTKINDLKTTVYMDSIKQYISGSAHRKAYISLTRGFIGNYDTEVKLSLATGAEVSLKRTNNYYKDYHFYTRPNIQKDTITTIQEDILYLNIDALSAEQVTDNIDKIRSYSKIILDLRGYPKKGNNELLSRCFPLQKEFLPFHAPIIYEPKFENISWNTGGWKHHTKGKKLDAKIVLLVDERSISYAESTSSYLRHNGYVTIIGRPTAGANGNINKITLNNDFVVIFTGMKVTRPDGSLFHTLGVVPDILVNETIKSVKEQRDVYIEEAIDFLNE